MAERTYKRRDILKMLGATATTSMVAGAVGWPLFRQKAGEAKAEIANWKEEAAVNPNAVRLENLGPLSPNETEGRLNDLSLFVNNNKHEIIRVGATYSKTGGRPGLTLKIPHHQHTIRVEIATEDNSDGNPITVARQVFVEEQGEAGKKGLFTIEEGYVYSGGTNDALLAAAEAVYNATNETKFHVYIGYPRNPDNPASVAFSAPRDDEGNIHYLVEPKHNIYPDTYEATLVDADHLWTRVENMDNDITVVRLPTSDEYWK